MLLLPSCFLLQRIAIVGRVIPPLGLGVGLGELLADVPLAGTLVVPLHAALPHHLTVLRLHLLGLHIALRTQLMGAFVYDLAVYVPVVGLKIPHRCVFIGVFCFAPVRYVLLVPISLGAGARVRVGIIYSTIVLDLQLFATCPMDWHILLLLAQHNVGLLQLLHLHLEPLEIRHIPSISTALPLILPLWVPVQILFLDILLAGILVAIVHTMNDINFVLFHCPVRPGLKQVIPTAIFAMASALALGVLVVGRVSAPHGEQLVGGQHF